MKTKYFNLVTFDDSKQIYSNGRGIFSATNRNGNLIPVHSYEAWDHVDSRARILYRAQAQVGVPLRWVYAGTINYVNA